MWKARTVALFCALVVGGCASRSENIAPAYVSPMIYEKWSCKELGEEATRVSARAVQLSGAQDSKATGDAVATGVALIIFWPAAFLIKGDGTTAAELAKLKGDMEAIEFASKSKKCGIEFKRPPPSANVARVDE